MKATVCEMRRGIDLLVRPRAAPKRAADKWPADRHPAAHISGAWRRNRLLTSVPGFLRQNKQPPGKRTAV